MYAVVKCAETGTLAIVTPQMLGWAAATDPINFAETIDCGDFPRAEITVLAEDGYVWYVRPQMRVA